MKYMYINMLLFCFVSCTGQKSNEAKDIEKEVKPLTFTMVTPPAVMTEPAERAEYLIKHYWDNFDFTDLRYIDSPEITEQAFVDYIHVLPHTTYPVVVESIQRMLRKAEADTAMFVYFTDLYEKYLHDPNSPFRNEEFYIPVLESILSSSVLNDTEKIRPLYLLDLANKNRVGEKATNFTYILPNGGRGSLYGLKAEYVLLYFYNPDCHSCKEITAELSDSEIVQKALKEGRLKILAVYPDEDLTAWKNHLDKMPANWINSHDAGTVIKDEEIYDLKAIPTIYLLNKDKEVVLKDTTVEELEIYMQQN